MKKRKKSRNRRRGRRPFLVAFGVFVLILVMSKLGFPTRDSSDEGGVLSTVTETAEDLTGKITDATENLTDQIDVIADVVSTYLTDSSDTAEEGTSAGSGQDAEDADIPDTDADVTPTSSVTLADDSYFEAHFIDVGQADAALIICDGYTMLIDGGNRADSDLMYTYLKNEGITYLDYVVGTHAHEDHIGGIAGALEYASAGVVYCSVTSYSSKAFENFVSAVEKQGLEITVPTAGDTFMLGSAEVTVLGPITIDESDPNNTSIVLRIVYGDTSFLFAGDAAYEEEHEILDAGYNLDSTVLKVGHHGSSTSTSYQWLYEIDPDYAVISCGAGNSYGHPHEETLSRLHDADVITYRTDLQGDIICVSDGTTVTFTVDRNADVDTLAY